MDAFAESPEWGGSLVIFPFMYYETYGDDSLIMKYYQHMRRYTDYLKTRQITVFFLSDWVTGMIMEISAPDSPVIHLFRWWLRHIII
mgnify:CR=1 FL=1